MAHTRKDNKLDQLISLVSGLAEEIKSVKKDVDDMKTQKIEIPEEPKEIKFESKETPYKVIPIEKIVKDESYIDPNLQGVKKIYMGRGQTFKNKEEAFKYLDRVQKQNPGLQYDIFPV